MQTRLSFVNPADACGTVEGYHHGKYRNLVFLCQIKSASSERTEPPAVREKDSLRIYLYTGTFFQRFSHPGKHFRSGLYICRQGDTSQNTGGILKLDARVMK